MFIWYEKMKQLSLDLGMEIPPVMVERVKRGKAKRQKGKKQLEAMINEGVPELNELELDLEIKTISTLEVDETNCYIQQMKTYHAQLNSRRRQEHEEQLEKLNSDQYRNYLLFLQEYGINAAQNYIDLVTSPAYNQRSSVLKDSFDCLIQRLMRGGIDDEEQIKEMALHGMLSEDIPYNDIADSDLDLDDDWDLDLEEQYITEPEDCLTPAQEEEFLGSEEF